MSQVRLLGTRQSRSQAPTAFGVRGKGGTGREAVWRSEINLLASSASHVNTDGFQISQFLYFFFFSVEMNKKKESISRHFIKAQSKMALWLKGQ